MTNFFTALLVAMVFLAEAVAFAGIKTYEGAGKYIMSDFENQDIAKMRAQQRAERDAQKKAGVYLKAFSRSVNSELTDDEISAVTNNIISVSDVQIKGEPFEVNGEVAIMYKATLKAQIDPNGIFDFIKREDKEKLTIVEQNNSLTVAINHNDKEVDDLKERYRRAETQADKDKLKQQMAQADKNFLANKKLEEGYNAYFNKNNHDLAFKLFTEAIELNPNLATAYKARGKILSWNDYKQEAFKDFQKVAELNPTDDEIYDLIGQFYFSSKDYSKALENYNKAIELNPNKADYYRTRAFIYSYNLVNLEQALADYSKIIELNQSETAYSDRGNLYKRLKNYDAAIDDYNQALRIDPNNNFLYVSLALAYDDLKDYGKAVECYTKAINLGGGGLYYHWRGETYEKLNDNKKATADYKSAVEAFTKEIAEEPLDEDNYEYRARVYMKLKDYKQAIQDFNSYLMIDPSDYAYNNRGECYTEMGDYEAALADFNKAIELDPKYAVAYYNRGKCYEAMGEQNQAQADFDKAKELGYEKD